MKKKLIKLKITQGPNHQFDIFMKIFTILFFIFFSTHVFYKDNFAIFGAVSNNCSEMDTILSLNNEEDPITIIDFMETSFQGYLSGINFFVHEISGSYKRLNEYSTDFMFEFVVEFCQNNPDKRFTDALTEYILILPNIE